MKTITSRRIEKRNKIKAMHKTEKEVKNKNITFHQPLHYQLETIASIKKQQHPG